MDNTAVTFDSYKDIKGYIINLERERGRYDNACNVLTNLGFSNLHRWRAVDAQEDDMIPLLQKLGVKDVKDFGKYTNRGQWACALSHIQLLEAFLESTEPYCLVFEDDVIAHTEFHKYANFLDIFWEEIELLSFGGVFVKCHHAGNTHRHIADALRSQGRQSHIMNAQYWQTHAYLCTREFAEKAVNKYCDWVYADTAEDVSCPYIDHYFTESGYFNTKLLAVQNPENNSSLRLHQDFGDRLCGILYQDNNFNSTIQTY